MRMDRISRALELPEGCLSQAPRFEMNGNREVMVEGCRSILQYDESAIRINVGKMIVCFLGRGLCIKCLTPDSLMVEGFITSIEFVT